MLDIREALVKTTSFIRQWKICTHPDDNSKHPLSLPDVLNLLLLRFVTILRYSHVDSNRVSHADVTISFIHNKNGIIFLIHQEHPTITMNWSGKVA